MLTERELVWRESVVILSQRAETRRALPKLAKQSDAYIKGNRCCPKMGLEPRKEIERVLEERQVKN
jgi:hypothetical protein